MLHLHRDDRRLSRLFIVIMAVAWCGGCSEELGPETMRTTSVRGTIRQVDRPIRGGWIEFIPADGTVGTQRSAEIGSDGTFSADRVPIGEVAIRLIGLTVEPPFPVSPAVARRIFAGYPPAIRRKIPEESSVLDLELIDELIKFDTRRKAMEIKPSGDPGAKP